MWLHILERGLRVVALACLLWQFTNAVVAQSNRPLGEAPRPNADALAAFSLPQNLRASWELLQEADPRRQSLKTLDGYFPFTPSSHLADWNRRADRLRTELLVASGLWPLPTKTPLHPVVHGRVERDDFTVDRVILETVPGHFLTGSLFKPKKIQGRIPGVLCPHGHFTDGRFCERTDLEVHQELASGAEFFPSAARNHLQARCVQLARMGCVVFHYDMEGFADNKQLTHRPQPEVWAELSQPNDWGYFSPQAELRLHSMFGLQTWNSLRALDWVSSLPEVDPSRLAVTGASGGGTQTFVLGAIDARVKVACPAVMVSTAMQGGCTCENACYLRTRAGNVDFAALFAPRPLVLTGANDWTLELLTKGYPELKQHYGLYGASDRVHAEVYPQFEHNYNGVSGKVFYEWFADQLPLEPGVNREERDFQPLSRAELTVWGPEHPDPPAGIAHERALLKELAQDLKQQQQGWLPTDAARLKGLRHVLGNGWQSLLGRRLDDIGPVKEEGAARQSTPWGWRFAQVLTNTSGERVACVQWIPNDWNKTIVVWANPHGIDVSKDPAQAEQLLAMLKRGYGVTTFDCIQQSQVLASGFQTPAVNESSGWDAQAACYTFGYNQPLFAQRVHDLLTVLAYLQHQSDPPQQVFLLGTGAMAPHALAAAAQSTQEWLQARAEQPETINGKPPLGPAVSRVAVDLGDFEFAKVNAIRHPDFLPGAVRYLDIDGLAALCAPLPVHLQCSRVPAEVAPVAYRSAGAAENLRWTAATSSPDGWLEWLLQP